MTRILMNRWFQRFAAKERISSPALIEAIERANDRGIERWRQQRQHTGAKLPAPSMIWSARSARMGHPSMTGETSVVDGSSAWWADCRGERRARRRVSVHQELSQPSSLVVSPAVPSRRQFGQQLCEPDRHGRVGTVRVTADILAPRNFALKATQNAS